jgi:hypothetical protein
MSLKFGAVQVEGGLFLLTDIKGTIIKLGGNLMLSVSRATVVERLIMF